ncbi:MAG: 3-dehydroquinate synthase [Ruminococcus sp.]|jgi:3-dehydroquinate synthase
MKQRMTVQRENDFSYEILWEDTFDGLKDAVSLLYPSGRKACIVTDTKVGPLYLKKVHSALGMIFDKVTEFVFEAGEANKTLDTVKSLYTHLIEHHFERKDVLIALGGGVTGDLTGFTAATYLRGIDFIQIPTTLLAQVDSSIGGKTGVDFDQFKNMVGAFHQPRLVYMCMETLVTLPDIQFSSGMGEVLKSGLIRDKEYYRWVLENREKILDRDSEALITMIKGSCQIKKTVVEHDPTEQGERAVLNLGHTIGHAVEKLMNFRMLHGHCVALGTVAAAYISWKRGLISREDLTLIRQGNIWYQLPVSLEGLSAEEIVNATKSDKKMDQGKIKFILLQQIGNAVIDRSVTDAEMADAVSLLLNEGDHV